MSDHQDPVDDLLREGFGTTPPALSAHFERNLSRRIHQSERRRLTVSGWLLLSLYALVAGVILVWGLARIQWSLDWSVDLVPAAALGPAAWIAVPFTFWLALLLPAWLRRLRTN